MRIIETKVYTIDEHPEPGKVYEWIRHNWHDLNNHSVDEFIQSLKALQKKIGGKLDYAISAVPDRGEFISLKNYDKEALKELDKDKYPLTGICWDYDIIEALQDGCIEEALHSLHADTEYMYSDEGLHEYCQVYDAYFTESGKLV